MTVTVTVPEEAVGDVIGDLNSRRGRPLGMEPKGTVTEVKAEVPMAEMLSYAPDLRDHRRAGRVLDGAGPLRGDPGAHRAIRRAGGRPGAGGGRRLDRSRPIIEAVKKELRPVHDVVTCDVCGRTILKGERAEAYLAPGGHRHQVCDLCSLRAQHEGWIRESAAGEMPTRAPRSEPPACARLAAWLTRPAAARAASRPESGGEPSSRRTRRRSCATGRRRHVRARDPRHVRAIPTTAQAKVDRALDLFNGSTHQRTIAGLARTLGNPRERPAGHRAGQPGVRRGRMGAFLVPLPGRPRRRGRSGDDARQG